MNCRTMLIASYIDESFSRLIRSKIAVGELALPALTEMQLSGLISRAGSKLQE